MIVCACHRISDRDITHVARHCESFDELQFTLNVATRCGTCLDCARETFEAARCGAHAGKVAAPVE